MIDKHVKEGVKKLLSLTRTKIRLAKEAGTSECRPSPLPLVDRFYGVEVNSVAEAESFRETLAKEVDYSDEMSAAKTVLACMDIIEGVKYLYEPKQYCFVLSEKELGDIEDRSREDSIPVNILLMTENIVPNSINLYIGEKPPKDAVYVSGVPTSLAGFLEYAFRSKHFSSAGRLKNISASYGRRTLINNAVYFSLGAYGADLLPAAK